MNLPNCQILQEILSQVPFRVHNVKLDTLNVEHDRPMALLRHYDHLLDDIKSTITLDLPLLKRMNDEMHCAQAAALLGIDMQYFATPIHVKLSGTAVLVFDELTLAVFVNFTNTAKDSQVLFVDDLIQAATPTTGRLQAATMAAVYQEAARIAFCGNAYVLYKQAQTIGELMSVDLMGETWTIVTADDYIRLPNSHAMATTHTLNTLRDHRNESLIDVLSAIQDKVKAQIGDVTAQSS